MPTEYAPKAISGVYTETHRLMPYVQNGGIIGDRAHTYGYHRCSRVLPSSDYSRQAPKDTQGIDPYAASALDLTPKTREQQRLLSKRLMASSLDPADPRLRLTLREWFGSTNGITVTGRSLYRGTYVSADKSHLWHIHLSIWRCMFNDPGMLQMVVEVLSGVTWARSKYNPANGGKVPASGVAIKPTYLKPYWVDPKEVSTSLIGNGSNGKKVELAPRTKIANGVRIEGKWLVTADDLWFHLDYLTSTEPPKAPSLLAGVKRTSPPDRYRRGTFHTTEATAPKVRPDNQAPNARSAVSAGDNVQVGDWIGESDGHGWVKDALSSRYWNFDKLAVGAAPKPSSFKVGDYLTTAAISGHKFPTSVAEKVINVPAGTKVKVVGWAGNADTHPWARDDKGRYWNLEQLRLATSSPVVAQPAPPPVKAVQTPSAPARPTPKEALVLNAGSGNLQGAMITPKYIYVARAWKRTDGSEDCQIKRFDLKGKLLDEMLLDAGKGTKVHPTGWGMSDSGVGWVTWNGDNLRNDVVTFNYRAGTTLKKSATQEMHVGSDGNIQIAFDDTRNLASLRDVTSKYDTHTLVTKQSILDGAPKLVAGTKAVKITRRDNRVVQGFTVKQGHLYVLVGLKSKDSPFAIEKWSFASGKLVDTLQISVPGDEPEGIDAVVWDGELVLMFGMKKGTGTARRLHLYTIKF